MLERGREGEGDKGRGRGEGEGEGGEGGRGMEREGERATIGLPYRTSDLLLTISCLSAIFRLPPDYLLVSKVFLFSQQRKLPLRF